MIGIVAIACGGPTPTAAPAPPAAGDPVVIDLVAKDIVFVPTAFDAPAGADLIVRLDNRDAGVPHNVALMGDAAFSTKLGASDIVSGPAFADLLVPGLIAGRYQLICEVHPNMTATLDVGA
jgi:plastocyanin